MILKKNKIANIALFFITIILIACIFFFSPKRNKTCFANVAGRINSGGEVINYNLIHKISIYEDEKGYNNLRGEVHKGDKTYNISRTLNFSYKKTPSAGIYQYKIISKHIFSTDNIPENVLSRYFTFLQEGTVRYIGVESIGNHNLLISDSAGPSFICNYY